MKGTHTEQSKAFKKKQKADYEAKLIADKVEFEYRDEVINGKPMRLRFRKKPKEA